MRFGTQTLEKSRRAWIPRSSTNLYKEHSTGLHHTRSVAPAVRRWESIVLPLLKHPAMCVCMAFVIYLLGYVLKDVPNLLWWNGKYNQM